VPLRVRRALTGYQNLVNPVWEEGKDAERHLYSFREPVPTVRAEFRRLFPHIPKELCVVAIAAEKVATQKPVLIRVGGGRTTPVTIVVLPGTQLQFQNTDPFAHRLFAVGVGTFPASDTVKGGVRSWNAPASGTVEIRDEAAPSLRMWVIAQPNVAAVAYPSLKGEFALSIDTPGEYRIQTYFAGKKVGPELPVKIGTADVDISKAPLKVADEPKGGAKRDSHPSWRGHLPGVMEYLNAAPVWYVLLGLLLSALVFVLYVAESVYNRQGSRAMAEGLSADRQFIVLVPEKRRARAVRTSHQVRHRREHPEALADSSGSESRCRKGPHLGPGKGWPRLPRAAEGPGFDASSWSTSTAVSSLTPGTSRRTGWRTSSSAAIRSSRMHCGFVRDETLVLDRVYRVVARPVEYDLGQAPAGAVVGARIIDDRFARELSERTGAAVAFYSNGSRIASGAPEGFDRSQLDMIVNDLKDANSDPDYKAKGRSALRLIGDSVGVVYSRLPGEAWSLGAGYVDGRKVATVKSPLGFFAVADDKDKSGAPILIVVAIALLAMGLNSFSHLEHSKPLAVFRDDVQRLAKGQSDAMQPSKFRGVYRTIASDVNDGIDVGGQGRRYAPRYRSTQVLGDHPPSHR
jgi:hypothetical protein